MSTQAQRQQRPQTDGPRLQRVLFVCLGNSCRSQMAEGFARTYGSDVMAPSSAGLTPAASVASDTIRAMAEKNIDIRRQFPKSWRHLAGVGFDLLINMSGHTLPDAITIPSRVWNVPDPVYTTYEMHCRVRDQIENLVMSLVLELRRAQKQQRA